MPMRKIPYLAVLLIWLSLALFSACSSQPRTGITKLVSEMRFSGASVSESDRLSPLSALCFDENGELYTLMQDSGRITAFNVAGEEIISFAQEKSSQSMLADSVEGVALGSTGDRIFMLDGKNARVLEWTKSGKLIRTAPVVFPLSPGDTTFGRDGEFYHNTEGLSSDSLILAFDTKGNIQQQLGEVPKADTLLAKHKSVRRLLAKGEIPGFMENSLLIAVGRKGRVYAVYRTKPILKCFENGHLKYERKLDFPELAEIREAAEIRNRLLVETGAYIPHSYWSDIAVDEQDNIYLLLALQTHHTIYRLDEYGNHIQKIIGDYGKGHLLTVQNERLAVADAAKRLVTIYAFAQKQPL